MKTRIISSLVGLLLVFAALYLYHSIAFNVIIALVYLIAVHEVHSALKDGNSTALTVSVAIVGIGLLMRPYLDFLSVETVIFLITLSFALSTVTGFHNIDFKTVASSLAFSLYVLAGFYSIIDIRSRLPYDMYGYDSAFIIMLCLGIAWGGDVCAYFAGYFFGKHKMSPALSPKKTVEGAIGGLAGSVFFGFLFVWLYSIIKPIVEGTGEKYVFSPQNYLPLATVCILGSCIAVAGDLFASAVKRQVGIKDYGKIMPGHGGVLDRFDSVLLLAPFINLLTYAVARRGGVFLV